MRLTRIHVDAALSPGSEVELPEAAATHLSRVLRLQPGDTCVLFNGDGSDHDASVVAIGKRTLRICVGQSRPAAAESPLRITLLQGIARGEKMDWILQKATELGVHAFVPTNSERSEVRLDGERAVKRLAHWRGVVVAACEQSGRAHIPVVTPAQPLADAVRDLSGATRWLLDPQARRSMASIAAPADGACVLAVGPEGGWSPRDLAVLEGHGFVGLRLGPRILRTETAGIAAVAALQGRFGDLAG